MTAEDQDRYWMQRALELARRGIGVTSPNPAVGCVILDCAGQVAGEGWHEYDLLDHAEVAALKCQQHAGDRAARRHGLRHAGALQPHRPHRPLHGSADRRRTQARRRRHHRPQPRRRRPRAGRAARRRNRSQPLGVCQAEARRLNEGFARWSQHQRPLVLMKVAMTLDGRIAPPPGEHMLHEPYWITSEAARAAVQPLRWQADAALTGVDTVLADDPCSPTAAVCAAAGLCCASSSILRCACRSIPKW